MNAYLDLMIAAHLIIAMVSLKFNSLIDTYRLKGRGIVKFIFLSIPVVFAIYLQTWLSGILIVIAYALLFFLFFRKNFYKPLLSFLFAYYFQVFVMAILTHDVEVFHFVLVIKKPIGALSILASPVIMLIFYLVTRAVDALYRLKNYRLDALIIFEGEKAHFKAYYDTGNTSTFDGVPIIFCIKKDWPFAKASRGKNALVTTINGQQPMELLEATISLAFTNDETMVYIALVESDNSFHGCECLLNAYLS